MWPIVVSTGPSALRNFDPAKNDAQNNWFNLPIQVSESDFASTDEKQLIQPRQPNGELPKITFLHPAQKSAIIDAGVDVGFPFHGAHPDLGAFER